VRERADLMFGRLKLRPSGAEHLSIFHQDDRGAFRTRCSLTRPRRRI
jgi:hypothetical protein